MLDDKFYEVIEKIRDALSKAVLSFSAIGMAVLAILIFAQVISRYLFNSSLTWTEEATRYVACWVVFMTVGYCIGYRQHVGIDIVYDLFPKRFKFYVDKVFCLLYFYWSYINIRYGFAYVKLGANTTASSFDMRQDIIYSIMPIGGFLMLFYTFTLFIQRREDSL